MSDACIVLKESNCRNCYKCIRQCPVKSIRFASGEATVIDEDCILCGRCVVACPQGAKQPRCDLSRARFLMSFSGAPVYASVAPSFVAHWGVSFDAVRRALLALGFSGAEETAQGATLVKQEYDRMLREGRQEVIVSSCCPSVNLLMQKYFPETLRCLAPVLSPMRAHAAQIKSEHPNAKVVFMGPCVAKKDEAQRYEGEVDAALTFAEVDDWLAEAGIALEDEAESVERGRARSFPVTGGILRSMEMENAEYAYLAVDGVENCITALRDIEQGRMGRCFIEMSACAGSCAGGPIMAREKRAGVRGAAAVLRRSGGPELAGPSLEQDALTCAFSPLASVRREPTEDEIEEVLRKLGKTTREQELNCGCCGYDTCREKAAAVCMGKADLTMCLPYLKEKAESFSDTILSNTPNGVLVLSEALKVQQINAAACAMLGLSGAREALGAPVSDFIDPAPLEAMLRGEPVGARRAVLARTGVHVDQTVLRDAEYHVVMVIMRDVTREENTLARKEEARRQTVEVTDKIINKQMRVVQEIASLLGETTAEMKVALTNLKESVKDER